MESQKKVEALLEQLGVAERRAADLDDAITNLSAERKRLLDSAHDAEHAVHDELAAARERMATLDAELMERRRVDTADADRVARLLADAERENTRVRDNAAKTERQLQQARDQVDDAVAAKAAAVAEAHAVRKAAEVAALEAARQRTAAHEQHAKLEAEVTTLRFELSQQASRLQAAEAERTAGEAERKEHEKLQKRFDALSVKSSKLEAMGDSQRLQASKLASAVARAQEVEGERARSEAALREELANAKEEAAVARRIAAAKQEEAAAMRAEAEQQRQVAESWREAEAAARQDAEEAKRQQQQQQQQQQTVASAPAQTIKEVLSSVKIAVLAPCLKLSISGLEPLHVGSPEQVDFAALATMLEEAILRKHSQVSLLQNETPLQQGSGGAGAIFPHLKDTMGHVQEEIKERLLAMMQNGMGGAAAGGGVGHESAPIPHADAMPIRSSPPKAHSEPVRPITVGGGARRSVSRGGVR